MESRTMLSTEDKVRHLATFVNRDDAGRHFTERYPDDLLDELEAEGLIEISRPVHQPTGIDYDRQYWTAEVTPEGVALVEAYPEYHPVD
jgi:hypothetical protein